MSCHSVTISGLLAPAQQKNQTHLHSAVELFCKGGKITFHIRHEIPHRVVLITDLGCTARKPLTNAALLLELGSAGFIDHSLAAQFIFASSRKCVWSRSTMLA